MQLHHLNNNLSVAGAPLAVKMGSGTPTGGSTIVISVQKNKIVMFTRQLYSSVYCWPCSKLKVKTTTSQKKSENNLRIEHPCDYHSNLKIICFGRFESTKLTHLEKAV